uniref:Neprilysin-1 n=1 Tax=Trittame loki TaxID=1295018 RepID=NEP_TRILK|nr:RecName: Full=Neprilysin-1; Flags: Precursor [Trittame loki]
MAVALLVALCVVSSRMALPSEAVPFYRQDSEVCNSPVCQKAAQTLLESMDTSVDPCQDFYQYACGEWIRKHPIPEEKFRISPLDALYDNVLDTVAEILKNATSENHATSVLKSANYFQACMDAEARETQGVEPLKNLLTSLGGWPMATPGWSGANYHWQTQVATVTRNLGIRPIIDVFVDADANRTSQHIINLDQADFGLGRNQLINLTSSSRTQEIVAGYRNYIIASAKLLNPNADDIQLANDADEIIQFESTLAQFSTPPEERRDASSWYHKMTVAEVQTVTENTYFQWTEFLNTVLKEFPQVMPETEVILYERDYTKNVLKLAHETNPRILANYIGWIVLMKEGYHTTRQFRENKFQFEKVQIGIEKEEKLERVCTDHTIGLLGYAVGRLYVDKFFTEEEKQDIDELVENIRSAYKSTLRNNTWMDHVTRNKAIDKLEAMINKMAYPTWIKNDNELNEYYRSVPAINRDEFFSSLLKVTKVVKAIQLGKWNKPTDRIKDWITTPAVVNAFYSPDSNSMSFPAGILNWPLYQYGTSPALNYGAIGAIIGHEMSHGFDDQGGQTDPEGNLVDWWLEETKAKFNQKADCFRKQYSSYLEPTTNMHLNGNNTVGENIADNGAVRNAFIAYKMHLLHSQNNHVMRKKTLPGLSATAEQLFFLGYSTMWCGAERKESLEWSIQYDSHTPSEFRAVVPLTNSRSFAEAFGCASGTPMNPTHKCLLW